MLEVLESFRIHSGGRPLLLACGLMPLAWVALRLLPARRADRALQGLMAGLALAALAAYSMVATWYASIPAYFDAAEPTMPIVGWLFMLGQPLYHDAASAERYSHIYGPLAFIAQGIVLRLAGPSIEASKWLGTLAGLGSLAFSFAACTTTVNRQRALVLTGGCALFYLLFRNYTFWTRPDALLVLAAGAGIAAAARGGARLGALGVGLTAGVLANLKITGPLYALPIFVLLATRHGRRPVVLATAIGAAVAGLPFLWPNVSLSGYLTWMRLSAHNGLMLSTLRQNIEWSAFLLLPITIAWFGVSPRPDRDRSSWLYIAALVVAIAGVDVAASKPGAGIYHLLPFVPSVAYAVGVALDDHDPLAADPLAAPAATAWMLTAALVALAQQASFIRTVAADPATETRADLRAFLDAHPGAVVQMAYNGYDRPTFVRPDLTFRSGLYLIDAPAVQEHQLSSLPVPSATIEAIRACRADAWLVPRGTEPFDGPNRYPAMALVPLFPDVFRRTFRDAYVKDGSTRFFDVWRCRGRAMR
jgi:hypothetical protein